MATKRSNSNIIILSRLLIFLLLNPRNIMVISSFCIVSTSKTNKIINNNISPVKSNYIKNFKVINLKNTSTTNEEENIQNNSEQYIPFKQTYNFNIPPLLRPKIPPMKPNEITQLSPTTLAYIGDVVYELFIRSRYIYPPQKNMSETQHVVVNNVRAETQSKVLDLFKCKFPLCGEEVRIMSRGRNASSKSGPKRFKKNGENDSKIYQDATAFETLIGYLYIKDLDRCYLALNCINSILDDMES